MISLLMLFVSFVLALGALFIPDLSTRESIALLFISLFSMGVGLYELWLEDRVNSSRR